MNLVSFIFLEENSIWMGQRCALKIKNLNKEETVYQLAFPKINLSPIVYYPSFNRKAKSRSRTTC